MQPHLAPTHTHTHSQPTQAREENVRRRPPCQQEMHSLRHNATPLSSNTHTHNLPRLDSRIHGSDFPANRGCTASGTMRPHLAPTHTHTHTHTHNPPRLERRMSGGDLPANRGCTASGTMRPHLAPTQTHSQPTQTREENIRRRPPCQQGMHSIRQSQRPQ